MFCYRVIRMSFGGFVYIFFRIVFLFAVMIGSFVYGMVRVMRWFGVSILR